MSLWDLLTVLSGFAALGGSFSAVKGAKIEGGYFVLALGFGLMVGIVCVWIIRMVGGRMLEYLNSRIDHQEKMTFWMEVAGRAVYFLAFMWFVVSSVLGGQITKLFIDVCLR